MECVLAAVTWVRAVALLHASEVELLPMMQNTPPLTPFPPQTQVEDDTAGRTGQSAERMAAVWVSRITSVAGIICLAIALSVWMVRPGHFRFVLALLTVAMFAAILHSYTFENGG